MQASSGSGRRRPFWLEIGPRRTAARPIGDCTLEVLVWRLAAGWRGRGGAAVGWVLPLAVVERRAARARWHAVPNLTLAVNVLGVAIAAWVAFGARRRAPGWRGRG